MYGVPGARTLGGASWGESLPLGTPAERHLLAILLVFASETVSTDRLVDELWGEDPPRTARNMVQRYVSRLRRALRDSGGERLVTEPYGYRLRIDDGELDGARFEELVVQGREAGDPGTACACFGEALDLWRGPFLDGVEAGPTVTAERGIRWSDGSDNASAATRDGIDVQPEYGIATGSLNQQRLSSEAQSPPEQSTSSATGRRGHLRRRH